MASLPFVPDYDQWEPPSEYWRSEPKCDRIMASNNGPRAAQTAGDMSNLTWEATVSDSTTVLLKQLEKLKKRIADLERENEELRALTKPNMQEQTLDAIRRYIETKGCYPRFDDLAEFQPERTLSAIRGSIETLVLKRKVQLLSDEADYPAVIPDGIPRVVSSSPRLRSRTFLERYSRSHESRNTLQNIKSKAKRRRAKCERLGIEPDDDLTKMRKNQSDCCWWCGDPLPKEFHIDHRVPLDKGGTTDLGNLCLTCPKCNLDKRAKMPYRIGRLL